MEIEHCPSVNQLDFISYLMRGSRVQSRLFFDILRRESESYMIKIILHETQDNRIK